MDSSFNRWKGKVALVTGAFSGIGAAVSEKLIENDVIVVGLDKDASRYEEVRAKMDKTKAVNFHRLQADVSSEQDVKKAFDWIEETLNSHVHVLVNSAGIVRNTSLINGDVSEWRKVFETNFYGTALCSKEAVERMRARNVDGQIINVKSMMGNVVPKVPILNVYPASKFAVSAFSESMQNELDDMDSKIKITCLSPAKVRTNILRNNGMDEMQKFFDENNLPELDPKDVANAVIYILSTPPDVLISEICMKAVGDKS